MSYIDAMIAQGGTPFDVAKYTSAGQAGQVAKQNDLLNLGRQKEMDEFDANAPVRSAEREDKISDFARKSTILGAKELSAYFDAADQAETPQQRLAVISKTLDFLDTRAENIKARGGNPADTVAAKTALENYIANPAMGQEELANVMNITKQLAEMDVGDGKADQLLSTTIAEDGTVMGNFRSGKSQAMGYNAEKPDLKYHLVKWIGEDGSEHQKLTVNDPTNRIPNSDGTVSPVWTPVAGSPEEISNIVSRISPHQITVENGSKQPSAPQRQSASQNGDFVSSVGGIAAQEGAKETAKQTAETVGTVDRGLKEGVIKDIQTAPTSRNRYLSRMTELRNTQRNVNKVIGMADESTTGFIGAVLKGVPGMSAYDMREMLLQNNAFLAFDRLNQMRTEESVTGGALGQVSNFEIDLLKAAVQSLNQAQSEPQIKRALGLVAIRLKQFEDGADVRERHYGNIMNWQAEGISDDELLSRTKKGSAEAANKVREQADYYNYQADRFDQGKQPFVKPTQQHVDMFNADPSDDARKEFRLMFGIRPEDFNG